MGIFFGKKQLKAASKIIKNKHQIALKTLGILDLMSILIYCQKIRFSKKICIG